MYNVKWFSSAAHYKQPTLLVWTKYRQYARVPFKTGWKMRLSKLINSLHKF